MPEQQNVRVICRFRPINARERAEGEVSRLDGELLFPDDRQVRVVSSTREPQLYTFDKVFSNPDTSQKEVYELAARDTIDDVIKGYNGTIFAYGQTGAGKSFTMFGPDISGNSELKGIIPRATQHIFDFIAKDREGIEFTIKCSFLEIYKEIIKDLLNPRGTNLKVHESPSRGVWVEDLTEQYVTCEQDVLDLLKLGEKFRATSATAMNAESSRSHSLFILQLTQKLPDGSSKSGKLNLADLAGSEKVGKTGATGELLEEAKKINQSLSALGNCINALTKSKRGHVPYRDSKLTHILRESLGGNTKTTLLIACSAHKFNLEETISTLKFGQRAKTIKNSVTINKQRSMAEMNAIVARLTNEIAALKRYVAVLEKELMGSKGIGWDVTPLRNQVGLQHSASFGSASAGGGSSSAATPSGSSIASFDDTASEGVGGGLVESDSEEAMSEAASEDSSASYQNALLDGSGPGSPAPESFGADRSSNGRLGSTAAGGGGGERDLLSLIEANVELEKLRESTSAQIQDLREDVQALTAVTQEDRLEILSLRQRLDVATDRVKQLEQEAALRSAQANATEQKLMFEVKQLRLKAETTEALLQATAQRATEVESELQKTRESMAVQTGELVRLRLDKARLEREQSMLTDSSATAAAAVQQMLETELENVQRLSMEKDVRIQSLTEQLERARRENKAMSATLAAQSADISLKSERIDQQSTQIEHLTSRLQLTEEEALTAMKAYHELQDWSKLQLAISEEAYRVAEERRRMMHIIKPVVIPKPIFHAAQSRLPKRRDLNDIAKEGFLIKEGGSRIFTQWQKRWCVMTHGFIYYFENPGSEDPKGAIPLEGCTVLEAAEHTQRKFAFGIFHPTKRTFFLQAQSQAEMEEWMAAIFRHISAHFGGMPEKPAVTAPQTIVTPAPSASPASSSSASASHLAPPGGDGSPVGRSRAFSTQDRRRAPPPDFARMPSPSVTSSLVAPSSLPAPAPVSFKIFQTLAGSLNSGTPPKDGGSLSNSGRTTPSEDVGGSSTGRASPGLGVVLGGLSSSGGRPTSTSNPGDRPRAGSETPPPRKASWSAGTLN